jgi:enterobacterial common antigen flippase
MVAVLRNVYRGCLLVRWSRWGNTAIAGSIGVGVLGQLLLLATGVLTARLLGPDGRGFFALFSALPVMATILAECGMCSAIAYSLSNRAAPFRVTRKALAVLAAVQGFAAIATLLVLLVVYQYFSGWSPGTHLW